MERLPDLSQPTSAEKDALIGELFWTIQALRVRVGMHTLLSRPSTQLFSFILEQSVAFREI
jgi:hypothetical protein